MISRRRFYAMVVFLLVALAITVTSTVHSIQQDLLVRGQEAIAAAGIPYYNLRIDGRDAVLAGFVTEGTDIDRLQAVVAQVNGIRSVRNEVTVERFAAEDPRRTTARHTPRSPELRIQHLGELLTVTGSLPADGSVAALETALDERFGTIAIRMNVRRDTSVGSRDWTTNIDLIVDALATVKGPSRIAAYGDVVQLSGLIANAARRSELDAILAAVPAVEWRLTLTRQVGGIGGPP